MYLKAHLQQGHLYEWKGLKVLQLNHAVEHHKIQIVTKAAGILMQETLSREAPLGVLCSCRGKQIGKKKGERQSSYPFLGLICIKVQRRLNEVAQIHFGLVSLISDIQDLGKGWKLSPCYRHWSAPKLLFPHLSLCRFSWRRLCGARDTWK